MISRPMMRPAYASALRVGVSWHFTLCTPSPITTSMQSARLLRTTTSSTCPFSDLTFIFSMSIAILLRGDCRCFHRFRHELREPSLVDDHVLLPRLFYFGNGGGFHRG